jgi:mannose-6-phosphate isomerase-like protein (cupin superfamily)
VLDERRSRGEHGLVVQSDGWFGINARDMRWLESEGWGRFSNFGGDRLFDQLGIGITLLGPGQPLSMYHWESDEENFLVLSGTATLIIEGVERSLRQWDFVHCPPSLSTRSSAGRAWCSASGHVSGIRSSAREDAGPSGSARANTP